METPVVDQQCISVPLLLLDALERNVPQRRKMLKFAMRLPYEQGYCH